MDAQNAASTACETAQAQHTQPIFACPRASGIRALGSCSTEDAKNGSVRHDRSRLLTPELVQGAHIITHPSHAGHRDVLYPRLRGRNQSQRQSA